MICACGLDMGKPKYRSDGFRYFHVYVCKCGFTSEQQRPHAEFLENERAMRGLDGRDCAAINAAIPDPGDFNYGRGR